MIRIISVLKFDPIVIGSLFLISVDLYFGLKIILGKVFKIEEYKNDFKRRRELESVGRKSGVTKKNTGLNEKLEKFIDKKFGLLRNEKFDRDMLLLDWGRKYPTINAWYAERLAKFLMYLAVGILGAILFHPALIIPAIYLGYSRPKRELTATVKAVKSRLLSGFPDFLRITQGYLASGFTFKEALKNSIPFLSPQWKRFTEDLVIDMELLSPVEALRNLKEKVDLVEVREFVAITTLSLEEGGDVKMAFDIMAKNIDAMLKDIMDKKIEMRKKKAQMIQPILMILMLAVFILPLVPTMQKVLSSMKGSM